ncbi:hypothetical protein [Paraburkholderia sp. J67]|uniref:hypothetical protein n=1 Tax=Paraburkholderia sp. J67 TaxID=2805435 RepID=UPI002ABD21C4|nr:hypothetical protein [Paraburkholderia sp. J67]
MKSPEQAAKITLRDPFACAARLAASHQAATSAAPRARRASALSARHTGAATNFATRRLLARHRTRRA